MSNGLNFIYAPCYAMFDALSSPNLGLLYVQQSGAAPICENYSMLLFWRETLRDLKGLKCFWFPFFEKKNAHFGQYWKLPKFSRLDPAHHNIKLYDLLMVNLFDPGIHNTAKYSYRFNIYNLIKLYQ